MFSDLFEQMQIFPKKPYFHKHRVKEDLRTVLLDPKGKKRKKE